MAFVFFLIQYQISCFAKDRERLPFSETRNYIPYVIIWLSKFLFIIIKETKHLPLVNE